MTIYKRCDTILSKMPMVEHEEDTLEESQKQYKCPECKGDMGIDSLDVSQPVYQIVDHPKRFNGENDLELWGLALLFKESFPSRDLYDKYISVTSKHDSVYRYIKLRAKKAENQELFKGYLEAVALSVDSGIVSTSRKGDPCVYSTVRARIQRWIKWGWVIKLKDQRKPSLIKCPTCKKRFNPYSILGSCNSELKIKTAQKSLKKLARPKHVAKKQGEAWKVIDTFDGEFTAKKIHGLVPKGISLTTVRLEIRKVVAEGKLEVVSFGVYKRKKDEQIEP